MRREADMAVIIASIVSAIVARTPMLARMIASMLAVHQITKASIEGKMILPVHRIAKASEQSCTSCHDDEHHHVERFSLKFGSARSEKTMKPHKIPPRLGF